MFQYLAPPRPGEADLRRHDTGRVAAVAVTLAEVKAVASVPTAGRADGALAGAGEVWPFGSVARGESTEDSDIDLAAVHGDLDHARRWNREQGSTRLGRAGGGLAPVDVMTTDLPESNGLWRLMPSDNMLHL